MTDNQLTPELAQKIKQQNLVNIINRTKDGKPLTAQQQAIVDKAVNPDQSEWPQYIGTQLLARCLGLSERWVQQMAEDGILCKTEKGKYPFPDVISLYVTHIKQEYGGRHNLKEREMQLKCEKLEQDIERRHDEVRRQVEKELTCEVIEGMQIIRDAYLKIKLPAKTVTQLRKAFEKAMQIIEHAKPQMDD